MSYVAIVRPVPGDEDPNGDTVYALGVFDDEITARLFVAAHEDMSDEEVAEAVTVVRFTSVKDARAGIAEARKLGLGLGSNEQPCDKCGFRTPFRAAALDGSGEMLCRSCYLLYMR